MKRTFEFNDGTSNKFWTIEIDGAAFTVTFGKAGTAGQSQTKTFADEAACIKEAEKLIREKTKKGYVEQGTAQSEPKKEKIIKKASVKAPAAFDSRNTRNCKTFIDEVASGNIDLIRKFVEAGATVDQFLEVKKNFWLHPFLVALMHKHNDVLRYFLSLWTYDNDDSMIMLVAGGVSAHLGGKTPDYPKIKPVKGVETLLEYGYDISRDTKILNSFPQLMSLPDELREKIFRQIDINVADGNVIYKAITSYNDTKYAIQLLDLGISPNNTPTTSKGYLNEYGSPLHAAIKSLYYQFGGWREVKKYDTLLIAKLIEKGADMKAENRRGRTPYEYATKSDDIKVPKEVIELLRKASDV
jgi:predicted DNA-binding WGR domain protein